MAEKKKVSGREIVGRAVQIAAEYQHQYVTTEHLLSSLLEVDDIKEIITGVDGEYKELKQKLADHLESDFYPYSESDPVITAHLKELIAQATWLSASAEKNDPLPHHFLVALLSMDVNKSFAAYFLADAGVEQADVKYHISHEMEEDEQSGGSFGVGQAAGGSGPGGSGQQVKVTKKNAGKILAKYCDDLNEKAKELKIDPLIGREDEVFSLSKTMARRTKNNAVLVGEPGVGKTAIAEGLAKLIHEGTVPEILNDARVYSLNMGSLLAGTRFRGDFEERVEMVLQALEIKADEEKPILFIDEIHMIMGAGSGGQGSMDVNNLLKPALTKGKLRCIGSTTWDEYRKHFEKDRALLRRFQALPVEEPSVDDAKRILRGVASYYEEYHGLKYEPEALDAAVDLTHRYVQNRFLPDKAIDIIDAAAAHQRVVPAEQRVEIIGLSNIEEEVSKVAKIPPKTVHEDESDKLARLEKDLRENVFGQEQAVEVVTEAVIQARAGLREPDKPLGSYLFTGPTGVGKTELAKQLAKTLGISLIRYDMSEYMEKHTVAKLIGAPPGYVGFDDGQAGAGKLVNDIEKTPHCVLLLDEMEKAHPDVYNVLLQVMDNATLTSSNGKSVSFKNVIIIMTSNAGASELEKNRIGFGDGDNSGDDESIIKKTFTPEFRNRLDAIVKFNKLKTNHIMLVVDKFIKELNDLGQAKNVIIDLDNEAREWLANEGFDSKMGARPLKRKISEHIKKPLSREMLFGSLKNGGTAYFTVKDNSLTFEVK